MKIDGLQHGEYVLEIILEGRAVFFGAVEVLDTEAETGEVIYGDVNGDEIINSADMLWIQGHTKGVKLEGTAFTAADVNRDGVVNSTDMVMLQNHIKGGAQIAQD